ncbi:MAG TPA: DNA polymerase III subunit beta [Nitrospiria bacterium]|nr:DNA polymerase III subunit beta [Nitrospiria bacterium]
MKVQIQRAELLAGLQRVQGVVEKRNTMPVLANILLEARGGRVTIFGTDLEIGIKGTHEAEVSDEGAIAVSARKLYEIIRELPEEPVRLTTTDKNWVQIEAGKSEFRIMGLLPQEFPAMPVVDPEQLLPVNRKILSELIRKTIFAVGDNDARYILNGVLLMVQTKDRKRQIRLVGTDGHRLAIIERDLPNGKGGTGELKEATAIIPKKAALEIKKLLDETEEEPELGISRNQLIFRRGQVLLLARLMEGNYPNYQQVIPKGNEKRTAVNRTVLEGALRRVSLMAKEKTNAIRMSLESGAIVLTSSNPDMGEAKEAVPVVYAGEGIVTGFNARYLLDALGAIEGDQALFEFKDSVSPCLIRQEGDEGYLCVVMPMRV